jgi:hypothetical protein
MFAPGRVLEYLRAFAKQRNLECAEDTVGNIVIKRPGTAGGEAEPVVVIQVGSRQHAAVCCRCADTDQRLMRLYLAGI